MRSVWIEAVAINPCLLRSYPYVERGGQSGSDGFEALAPRNRLAHERKVRVSVRLLVDAALSGGAGGLAPRPFLAPHVLTTRHGGLYLNGPRRCEVCLGRGRSAIAISPLCIRGLGAGPHSLSPKAPIAFSFILVQSLSKNSP